MRSCRSRETASERPHVVQAVGQLDDDDADVLDHREQHLAEALGLAVFAGVQVELAELGDAVDAARDVLAEPLADLFDRDAGVLHHIVEQAGLQRHHVHPHVGQNVRHHERVEHVGLARVASLAFVVFSREGIGLTERCEVFARA